MKQNQSLLDNYVDEIRQLVEQGKTNQQVADELTAKGVQTTETSVRRFLNRHRIERKAVDLPEVTVDPEVEPLRNELESTRRELKEATTVIKRYRERESVESRIVDIIDYSLKHRPYERPLGTPKLKNTPARKDYQARGHEFVCLVSDAHYGEVVNPDEALGILYNPDVTTRRIGYLRDKIIKYAELRSSAYPIEKVTVPVLGDMVSGSIHEELEVTNNMAMVDQVTDMAHILYNFATDLSTVFPKVEMIVMPGNHPRVTKKPRFKQRFNNWEFLMGKMVEGMVQYGAPDNVNICVPRDMVYVHEVFGFRIAMVHGDGVKSNSFAGIPFYGMRNQREAVQALMSQTGQQRVDMFVMGHFHQHMYWAGECDILINGAIKGGDEYGIGTRLSAPDPMQVLMEFHPEHGLTSQNHINLGHIN